MDRDGADTTLLEQDETLLKQPRYGTSEFRQFLIILKRALLFSRRDWVIMTTNDDKYKCLILHYSF